MSKLELFELLVSLAIVLVIAAVLAGVGVTILVFLHFVMGVEDPTLIISSLTFVVAVITLAAVLRGGRR